jgi:hypothetical protein
MGATGGSGVVVEDYGMVKIHAIVRIRSLPVWVLEAGNGLGDHAVGAGRCDGENEVSHFMPIPSCWHREWAVLDENAL